MNYFRCGGGRSTHTATKIDVAKTPLATFQSNVSGLYIPEILAYFTATQAGTGDPSPSNVRPINGVSSVDTTRTGGKNILDPNATVFGNYTISPDGSHNEATDRLATHYLRCKGNTSYKAISDKKITSYTYAFLDIAFYDENLNYINRSYTNNTNNSFTFTTPANAKFLVYSEQFSGLSNITPTVFETYDRCLVEGEIDSYEPFVGNTYTIQFGGTYYGGYLNVTTGVLTVTYGMIKLSDIPKTKYGTYEAGARFITTFFDTISNTKLMGNSLLLNAIGKTLQTPYPTSGSWLHFSAGSSKTSFLIDQADVGEGVQLNISNVNSWLDSINAYAVYELATPQTVQLTPAQIEQLLGQNNVFCSSGDVAVKYWKID